MTKTEHATRGSLKEMELLGFSSADVEAEAARRADGVEWERAEAEREFGVIAVEDADDHAARVAEDRAEAQFVEGHEEE